MLISGLVPPGSFPPYFSAEFGFWGREFCYGFSLCFALGFALGGSFLDWCLSAVSRRTFRQNSDSGVVNFVMDSLYVLF